MRDAGGHMPAYNRKSMHPYTPGTELVEGRRNECLREAIFERHDISA